MTRIDLRYIIVVVVFYTPGLMFLLGAWMLGYSYEEARDFVAICGLLVGLFAFFFSLVVLFDCGEPIWFYLPAKKGGEK